MFADPLPDVSQFEAPGVSSHEVFRVELRRRGEGDALRAAALMCCHREIPPSSAPAPQAARLSREGGPATARLRGAKLWTQDADFKGMAHVRYFPAKPA